MKRTREQLKAIFAELSRQGKLRTGDVLSGLHELMPPLRVHPIQAGARTFETLPLHIQRIAYRLRMHRKLNLDPLISSRRLLPLKDQFKAELRDFARRKISSMPIKGEGSSILFPKAKPISVEGFLEHMADQVATGAHMASNKLINLARSKAVQAVMPYIAGARIPEQQLHSVHLANRLFPKNPPMTPDQIRKSLHLTRGIFPPLEHAISTITIDRTARRFLKRHLLRKALPQLIRHSRAYHHARRTLGHLR